MIGGGQLGMMLAEAAEKYNHLVFALEPKNNPPIGHTKAFIIPYAYDDPQGLELLNLNSDVIIYEFENVDVDSLMKYAHKLPQGTKALEISQDRIKEKKFAQLLDIPTVRYIEINSQEDYKNSFFPSVLKTTRLGYDGKGQYLLKQMEDIQHIQIDQPMILEEYISFDDEVSVVLTRDMNHHITYLPLIKNKHTHGILDTSYPLWDCEESLKKEAYSYAKRIADELNYIGTLAIEFFVKDGHIIFNEMAPRPHNSGHFSIEGATVSQFENMILAVTNHPIIEPKITKRTLMINVLGQHHHYISNAINLDHVFIHDYHKDELKNNRKMGHIICFSDTEDELFKLEKTIKGELHG